MLSEKPWKLEGIIRLMAGIFACLCFVSLFQFIAQYFVGKDEFEEGSLLYLLFTSLSLHGSILLGTGFFLWWHHQTWSEAFGFRTPPVVPAILLGILAALVFLPVGMVLQDVSIKVLNWSHVETPPQAAVDEFNKTVSFASRAYLAAFAIILAPIAEEIFFRGILYPALKQIPGQFHRSHPEDDPFAPRSQYLYPRFALWGSAVIFAAIHHSVSIFVPLLVLGAILAWLYEKTNNLLACITAHSVFNAINMALLIVGDRLQDMFDQHFHHP